MMLKFLYIKIFTFTISVPFVKEDSSKILSNELTEIIIH